ncbi:MAG: sensor histidine kinase [Planctomycetota bacterium]
MSVDAGLPAVRAHRAMLTQVIVNLLSNAIRFVGRGVEPRVRIRGEPRAGRVRLWVEDNGIGISAEHHERIFHMFERLNRQEDYPGTGIGLAIVRKAMERMGGAAGIESELGRGSRFWIELEAAEG